MWTLSNRRGYELWLEVGKWLLLNDKNIYKFVMFTQRFNIYYPYKFKKKLHLAVNGFRQLGD